MVGLLLIVFGFGCTSSINKSLIMNPEKLLSPFSDDVLYRYTIESSMAFGSPITVIKILSSNEDCSYTYNNNFRFGNDYPFYIKWKNKGLLQVKCLISGADLADKQPIRRDTLKWKDWTFEVEYYTEFSGGAETKYLLDGYSTEGDSITFRSKEDTSVFKNNEVQFSLDTNNIHAVQFYVVSFNKKLGLSFSNYDFQGRYDKRDFLMRQPFIRVKP